MMEEREGIIAPHQLQVNKQGKLGQGGFGVVYRGKYRGREVAIKELLIDNLGPKAKQEFKSFVLKTVIIP